MKILKQSIGIDVSKDSLACCIGSLSADGSESFSKTKTFVNAAGGFLELTKWVSTLRTDQEVLFVMEATGVYYENLAYYLDQCNEKVSVLLPNKAKHFAGSLNVKTKTDSVDAQLLARFGLERKLDHWKISSKIMLEIKFLTREYREAKAKLVVIKNQLHAKNHSHGCPESVELRLKIQIDLLEKQLIEIEAEVKALIKTDNDLDHRITKLNTIPGIGFMTITTLLAETNCFALVKNAKQLASYAGLDIRHNQSGIKENKTRISKKGNSFIRNALYMPALCAGRHNPAFKSFYSRLCDKKPAKKIAVTAVARKLLILVYVLWKNETSFNADYLKINEAA
jgi:transposase